MSDREQIIELLARLAAATDSRDWAAVREIFSADGYGYGQHGVDSIVAVMRGHLDGCGPTQHLLGNHRVSVDGDTARSWTYGRVYHQGAPPMEDRFFECLGDYDDRWVRTAAGWKLASRHFDMRITMGDFTVLRGAQE